MEQRMLTIGHSPDPDDAFMFYALTHRMIDTGPYRFQHQLEDIETLNQRALRGELDITAVSMHAYAYLTPTYALLRSGSSMGKGYGPILVARHAARLESLREHEGRIAVPGTKTTAFLVARMCLGEFTHEVLPFDEILEAVRDGKVEAGLVIHEGQLTYRDYDLTQLLDLGQWWQQETDLPLPLGVNVVRQSLGTEVLRDVSRLLRASLDYAMNHRQEVLRYAMEWGRGLDDDRTDRFVSMYVNDYTLDVGDEGQKAIETLLSRAWQAQLIADQPEIVWAD